MDRRLLEEAITGDSESTKHLASHHPALLHGRTPQWNTCLHIASIHGHERFCKDVLALDTSLLAAVNSDGETPLLTAVRSGHVPLAFVLLRACHEQHMRGAILKQDEQGFNALHHAIRSGHRELALKLIATEPALSRGVNKFEESPMFLATPE
nr:unnamed protein product [Digitaria exilis]